jgi:predicted Zn-dependent protease
VLRDCGKVLVVDEKNIKALYRSAKACLAIDKLDEAEDAITRAMNLDPSNSTFQNLKLEIAKRKGIVSTRNEQAMATATRKREAERTLQAALKVFFSLLELD